MSTNLVRGLGFIITFVVANILFVIYHFAEDVSERLGDNIAALLTIVLLSISVLLAGCYMLGYKSGISSYPSKFAACAIGAVILVDAMIGLIR